MIPGFNQWIRFYLCLCISGGFTSLLNSQNLVPNHDFEDYTTCPDGYSMIGEALTCLPWRSASDASTDYFNACANPNQIGVPQNDIGYQEAHSGVGYAGFLCKAMSGPNVDYREYIQTPLAEPLQAGETYVVSFWVNLGDESCAVQHIGAYLSAVPPLALPNSYAPFTDYTPQIESTDFITDIDNWTLVCGYFVAEGGEQYITLGNFHSNADSPYNPECPFIFFTSVYYYIDDVYVALFEDEILDLEDGPVTDCEQYTIESGLTNVQFLWSTGSTEPDITVFNSGIYALTVFDGCVISKDSVEFININQPPVLISPNDTTFCDGGSVSYSLDPDMGIYTWSDGTISNEYTITNEGLYTVSLDDGCDITTDEVMVNVMYPPLPFTLGPDTSLCVGDFYEIEFDPDLGIFEWQDGSSSNTFTIIPGGYYSLIISNACGEYGDDLQVSDIGHTQLQLPIDADTLCNGTSIDLSLDMLNGAFLWQDGSTESFYHIAQAGLYAVTFTDQCGMNADSILITTSVTPNFDLGLPVFPCPKDTLFLTAGTVQGDHHWQDGSSQDSLMVLSSGTYALTITNACGTTHDSVVVQYIDPLLPVNLGPNFNLCMGQQFTLNAGHQLASYLWQDQSTADTLNITSPGIYVVTVSNSCITYVDSVIVTPENNPPSLELIDTISLCQGAMQTIESNISGVNFDWSDGSHLSTLTVVSPGVYSLTVSNFCGADQDTVVVLDGGSVPVVELGNNAVLCEGTVLNLQPVSSNVTSWLWSDGATNPTASFTVSGIISVEVRNACGVSKDTMELNFISLPSPLNIGNDTSLCPGSGIVLSILEPNVNINWSTGSHDPDVVIDQPGMYSATIANMCGTSYDTILVGILAGAPVLDLGIDLPLCPGDILTINPGIDDVNYLWQDGSTDTFFVVNQNMTVTLTIANDCGFATDDIEIFSSTTGPELNLGPDVEACEGDIITLSTDLVGVSYEWQDGSTTNTFNADHSGEYILNVANSCGTDADTIHVHLQSPPSEIDLGNDTILCEGKTITLFSSTDPLNSTIWQDGSTQPTLVVTTPGTYSILISNACGISRDTLMIAGLAAPLHPELGHDTLLCAGETLLLHAPVTTDLFHWQDGSSAPTYLIDQAGTYSLTVSNECGMTSDEIKVQLDFRKILIPQLDVVLICPDESVLLDASQPFTASYAWNTGEESSSVTIVTPGEYVVTVQTNCDSKDHLFQVMDDHGCYSGIYIPNIFSPNNDQINGDFKIYFSDALEILSLQGTIYDRWGNVVYSSDSLNFSWDGTFNGEHVLPGVYVYRVEVSYDYKSQRFEKHLAGDVTVVR